MVGVVRRDGFGGYELDRSAQGHKQPGEGEKHDNGDSDAVGLHDLYHQQAPCPERVAP